MTPSTLFKKRLIAVWVVLATVGAACGGASDSEKAEALPCDVLAQVVSTSADFTVDESAPNSGALWQSSEEDDTDARMWVLQTAEGVSGPSVWLWRLNTVAVRPFEFDSDAIRDVGDRQARPTDIHPVLRTMMFTNPEVPIEESQEILLAMSVNIDDAEAWALAPELLKLAEEGSGDFGDLSVQREGPTFIPPVATASAINFADDDRNILRVQHGCFEPDPTTDILPTDLFWAQAVLRLTFASLTGDEEVLPISIGPSEGLLIRADANSNDEFYRVIASTEKAAITVTNLSYAGDPIEEVAELISSTLDFE